jgi:hypothetical protein
MLAVVAGYRNELIQDLLLGRPSARLISLNDRLNQFRPCRHTDPPCHPSSPNQDDE